MEDLKLIDEYGHSIYISEKELGKIKKKCDGCERNLWSKKYIGKELNFITCQYDCDNDISHYRLLHPDKVRYE